jgi:hypothetical protein
MLGLFKRLIQHLNFEINSNTLFAVSAGRAGVVCTIVIENGGDIGRVGRYPCRTFARRMPFHGFAGVLYEVRVVENR